MIGTGLAAMAPGSLGLQLVVADMDGPARDALVGRGVDVSEIEVLGRPGRPGFRFALPTPTGTAGSAGKSARSSPS